MQFNRKFQSLNTYKTNNTGKDVTREFKSFDINVLRYRREKLSDYIQIVPPSVQALTRERELFNRTHQVTSNNLFQLKNGMNNSSSDLEQPLPVEERNEHHHQLRLYQPPG